MARHLGAVARENPLKSFVADARRASRTQSRQGLGVGSKEVMFPKWQRHLQSS
jgi:hypothetical protein